MSQTANIMARHHPLQRLRSPSRSFSATLHLAGLVSFGLSFKYLVDFPNLVNDSYGWHMQYLTIIGLSLATLTFAFGLLADITLSPQLFLVKNALSVCSAPLEVLISVLYWGISAVDKRLVVPEWVELDPTADIGFHAMPALLLTIDLLFFSPPWTISALPAMGISGALAMAYWAWIEHCFKHNGWYPYPLFEQLTPPFRAALFGVSAITMTLSTATLQWLYGRVNGFGTGTQAKARPDAVKEE